MFIIEIILSDTTEINILNALNIQNTYCQSPVAITKLC